MSLSVQNMPFKKIVPYCAKRKFFFTHDGPMTVLPLPVWEVFNTPPPWEVLPLTVDPSPRGRSAVHMYDCIL